MNKQIEQILDEIKRWKKELRLSTSCEAKYRREMLDDLSEFIDTLQKEPVSEDLKEAAFDYAEACKYSGVDKLLCVENFKAGAKWQKEQMIKDVINAHIAESFIPVSDSLGSYLHGFTCTYEEKQSTPYVKVGDKVKLIIVKEEEK